MATRKKKTEVPPEPKVVARPEKVKRKTKALKTERASTPTAPPPPPTEMKIDRGARLRVLQDATTASNEVEPAQDCGSCLKQPTCWMDGIKEEHIILNLLVCRIKRGIEVNRSSKLFLQMVRPKLKMLAKQAVYGTNIPVETALADMESQTLMQIQHRYVMGEIYYPLPYLFSPHNGHIVFYVRNYGKKTKTYESFELPENTWKGVGGSSHGNEWQNETAVADMEDENAIMPGDEEETETDETKAARQVVDDGITLSLIEFRILSFCLKSATDAKRPLNGLHIFLSRTMNFARAKITKTYGDACKKMVSEVRTSR